MTRTIIVLAIFVSFAGCYLEPGAGELRAEVDRLTLENSKLRGRLAQVETDLTDTRETTIIATNAGGFELRLNLETALVIVAIVAGIVIFLVFYMRYRLLAEQARWERSQNGEQPPA